MGLLQRLRERFWFVPAVLCLAAFVLAEVLIAVDQRLRDVDLPGWVTVALYRVGESGSRDILGAIASSSLAVAGTTFSITMAVLALTSSSYGPRLVRNFMADRGNQVVLGVYVATFLYSLMVLRSVRVLGDPGPDAEVFVPHLAVNVAVLLALADVAVLVYFIHHISDSIQVSTLAGRVRAELLATVDRLYPADLGLGPQEAARRRDGPRGHLPDDVDRTGRAVTAGRAGYLRWVEEQDLLEVARRHDVVVALRVRPGEYLLEDTVVARVHPPGRDGDEVADDVRDCLGLGGTRSPHQDVEFAVQQLTEMAVRALSPGTNDPYTAINALDDLSVGLAALVSRPVPAPERYDDDGVLRLHAVRPEVTDLLAQVLDAMRWYAVDHPSVVHATLDLVDRTRRRAQDPQVRGFLDERTDLLLEAVRRADVDPHDVRALEEHARRVRG